LFYLFALVVFLADRSIKYIITSQMAPGRSISIIKAFLNITYVRNTGVAFGLFPGKRLFLVLIGLAICAIVIYFNSKTSRENMLLKLCLTIILGGSLGNLFDRIFFGYVIDYLDFRVFPVFNLADIAINLGVFLIIMDFVFKRDKCTR